MSQAASPTGAPSTAPAMRNVATISTILAVAMSTVDTTIANVALPHMQGSLSAGQDQVTWILTSFIVSQTLMTPLVGWTSGRIGRKNLLLLSVAAFTVSSLLCAIATNLPEMVLFRVVQGASSAAFTPIAQAILYDINEPKDYPKAMALFGASITLGPIIGPVLGGWLTDTLDWRWCFLINIPLGALSFAGIWVSLPKRIKRDKPPFDFMGFGSFAVFLTSFQLMLDRGPGQDWFSSIEIRIYLTTCLIGLYLFVVQTIKGKKPFFSPLLMRNSNFLIGIGLTFILGGLVFSVLALLPTMLQGAMNLPAVDAGLAMAPRGLGVMITMLLVGRLASRLNETYCIAAGFLLNAVAMAMMTQVSPLADTSLAVQAAIVQGVGIGLIFICVTTITFSEVPANLREEAASIAFLARSLGASAGIATMQAILVRNIQTTHAKLAENVSVDNPILHGLQGFDISTLPGLMALDGELYRQAAIISFLADFHLAMVLSLLTLPLLLFVRRPERSSTMERPNVHFE